MEVYSVALHLHSHFSFEDSTMRGDDRQQDGVFSYISPEARVPQGHPLRVIRALVDRVLHELSPRFAKLYSQIGRPSIPPEKLLRALLLQVLYTIRSERHTPQYCDIAIARWEQYTGKRVVRRTLDSSFLPLSHPPSRYWPHRSQAFLGLPGSGGGRQLPAGPKSKYGPETALAYHGRVQKKLKGYMVESK